MKGAGAVEAGKSRSSHVSHLYLSFVDARSRNTISISCSVIPPSATRDTPRTRSMHVITGGQLIIARSVSMSFPRDQRPKRFCAFARVRTLLAALCRTLHLPPKVQGRSELAPRMVPTLLCLDATPFSTPHLVGVGRHSSWRAAARLERGGRRTEAELVPVPRGQRLERRAFGGRKHSAAVLLPHPVWMPRAAERRSRKLRRFSVEDKSCRKPVGFQSPCHRDRSSYDNNRHDSGRRSTNSMSYSRKA
jgi:hypothetical protein